MNTIPSHRPWCDREHIPGDPCQAQRAEGRALVTVRQNRPAGDPDIAVGLGLRTWHATVLDCLSLMFAVAQMPWWLVSPDTAPSLQSVARQLSGKLGAPATLTVVPDVPAGHAFVRPGQVAPHLPAPDQCARCGEPEAAH